MKVIGIVSLLVCTLIVSAIAQSSTDSSSVKIEVFSGSNPWWIAIQIHGAEANVLSVQIRDQRFDWDQMNFVDTWGKWTYSARGFEFEYPISFRLYASTGEQILVDNAIFSLNGASQMIDTGVQLRVDFDPKTPTGTPVTEAPTTSTSSVPSVDKTSPAPSVAATDRPTTTSTTTTTTVPPKTVPTTTTSTTTTTTPAPTTTSTTTTTTTTTPAPTTTSTTTTTTTTRAPTTTTSTTTTTTTTSTTTTTTTQAPVYNGGCSTPMKIMTPLYVYPGAAWDKIIDNAAYAQSIAIVNPNSGPGNGPNADYVKYMNKMAAAGVEMIGYVHTSYGNRDINVVKADINKWAMNFQHVSGIFLDEASADAGQLPYYRELYNYIMSMPGWKYDVVNPGIIPDAGYMGVSTQIVTFENYGSEIGGHSAPTYGSCANKEKFVAMAHTVGSGDMGYVMNQIKNKGYFGWVYVTDGAGGCCTYNQLTTYYANEAQYMKSNGF